eukprot:CAMPEP_0113874020 /NCGR_PEP_ID=MMETSP0780_2-20120614/4096_1 /TAXON_ID=652834 /ORGANISM="Palpitomonas bilix" /LENGTH=200 /DNA_ID=CAMNT_0000859735 /DNA_START=67 /DNA_END=669 /DNA_ORIENTATION=- /assembly_acc=CAM_ASM_000599
MSPEGGSSAAAEGAARGGAEASAVAVKAMSLAVEVFGDEGRYEALQGCPSIPREEWEKHENYKNNVGHFLRFHNNFRSTLDALVKQPNYAVFRRLFQNLNAHHRTEERVLFPFVQENYKGPADKDRMSLLKQDHYHLDRSLEETMELFTAMKNGQVDVQGSMEKLMKQLNDLRDIVYRHLQDEEDVLCPLMLEDTFKELF